jgi:hypothetical protein
LRTGRHNLELFSHERAGLQTLMNDTPDEGTLTEQQLRDRLGLDPRHIPKGFTWKKSEQAWVRTVQIDPSGKDGMHAYDAEQLALLVAYFNSEIGHQALRVYFEDVDSGNDAS